MSIRDVSDARLKEVMAANLTPSDLIKTPERLFGRARNLITIERAFNSPGRQVFIYGDRGVGKSSLALTAALLCTSSGLEPIHVNCGSNSGFGSVIQAVGNWSIPVKDRLEKAASRGSFGFNAFGVGANITPAGKTSATIPVPETLNEALDVIRYVGDRAAGKQLVVVIDEMERLKSPDDREQFAEFIKNVQTAAENVRFIFCGIASDVTELLGAHPSAGRVLETLELPRIPHDSLWEIINTPARVLGVEIDRDKLIRIGQISDGFPHYVHLIGESLFWAMFDDPNECWEVSEDHFKAAVKGALSRTEAVLRNQYDRATQKTKNTEDYAEALWALADKRSDRRQLSDIYEFSYSRIMMRREGRSRLTKDKLNQRLLALRKETHGRIVAGYGSGWYGFRENIMRGYVRLDAENHGVQLGRE